MLAEYDVPLIFFFQENDWTRRGCSDGILHVLKESLLQWDALAQPLILFTGVYISVNYKSVCFFYFFYFFYFFTCKGLAD